MVTVTPAQDMAVSLGPLRLPNPITLASGTCGYASELAEYLDLGRLGGAFTKGLTLAPRQGNPPARIAETPAGMINRIGLQNVGVEAFIAEKLPALTHAGVPVIANVAGATIAEYLSLAERLDGVAGLDGIELNVSCPNVDQGGIEFGTDARVLERLVAAVRRQTTLPLIVKLTPNVTAIAELARAAEAGGADALSAINTVTGLAVTSHAASGKLAPKLVRGGLSGPAIKPIALRCVWEVVQAVHLPVIGIGGISSLTDVLDFFAVGAKAVQIGTASFVEPGIADRLVTELAQWLQERGVARLTDVLPELEVQR